MTTAAPSVTEGVATGPVLRARNFALDRVRSFIIILVLIHHSVIPYSYYGRVDRQSFLGFDAITTFNDTFIMAAMFLLSGLFVWPSLQRKGVSDFLRGRLLRLGVPLVVGSVILMPLAYYTVELRNSGLGFPAFWWKTVTVGPWESGPIWFLGVLLAFDVLAVVVYRVAPRIVDAIGRLSIASIERPALAFWTLLAASIIAYVPPALYYSIGRWFVLGPLAVQASRVLLYFLYFLVGVGIGAAGIDRGLLSRDGRLARQWPTWLAVALLSFAGLIALVYYKREFLPDPIYPPLRWDFAHDVLFACFCASQTINTLALFLRFNNDGWSIFDPLRESSFGIYLIHYVPLLWLQYALFGLALVPNPQMTAILKAVIVFVLTLAISWAATEALRKIPGAKRVL
jgi:hypothetical protein